MSWKISGKLGFEWDVNFGNGIRRFIYCQELFKEFESGCILNCGEWEGKTGLENPVLIHDTEAAIKLTVQAIRNLIGKDRK